MNKLTSQDRQSMLDTIWHALECYREDCIPEGEERYDEEWNDIFIAMTRITRDLQKFDNQEEK